MALDRRWRPVSIGIACPFRIITFVRDTYWGGRDYMTIEMRDTGPIAWRTGLSYTLREPHWSRVCEAAYATIAAYELADKTPTHLRFEWELA